MKRNSIVVFGKLNISQPYSRNLIHIKALKQYNWNLFFCTVSLGPEKLGIQPGSKIINEILSSPLVCSSLILKYCFVGPHALIYVPYPAYVYGIPAVFLARLKKKKVIIDGFIGLYDTIVRDRQLFRVKSLVARFIWWYEKKLLRNVDCTLMDTEEQAAMLRNDYSLLRGKVRSVPVGIDEDLWKPLKFPQYNKTFEVVFWGTFIPLHGLDVIAHAAKKIEGKNPKVQFTIIGTGQEAENFKKILLSLSPGNIKWINRFLPIKEMHRFVKNSHCCLGVFSENEKTQRVIPYKAYQALASARPLVTADSSATQSVFVNRLNAMLVQPGDAQHLANTILELAENYELALDIGKNGRILYEQCFSNEIIYKTINHIMEFST